jgi:hypothetical protein
MNRNESIADVLQTLPSATVPWLLVTGLTFITAAQFVTMAPVMVGVATLMLGSTLAIQHRVPTQLRLLVVTANLIVYLGLYALFLGALIHQTTLWMPIAPPWFRLTDLGASLWLVILSLQVGVRQIQAAI